MRRRCQRGLQPWGYTVHPPYRESRLFVLRTDETEARRFYLSCSSKRGEFTSNSQGPPSEEEYLLAGGPSRWVCDESTSDDFSPPPNGTRYRSRLEPSDDRHWEKDAIGREEPCSVRRSWIVPCTSRAALRLPFSGSLSDMQKKQKRKLNERRWQ